MNLSLSQIPPSIDTVEKLFAWSGFLLQNQFQSLKSKEAENYMDFVAQVSIFKDADTLNRAVFRVNLPLEPLFESNGQKLYLNVREFGEANIPPTFL